MFRVTKLLAGSSEVALKLEGQLVSEWVEELKRECRQLLSQHERIHLDFEDVTHVDRRGAEMLKSFGDGRLNIVNCPPLLKAVLSGEDAK